MAHEYLHDIKCPHCDYQFSDSWEYNNDDGCKITCHNCDKDFQLSVDFDVTYSTSKISCKDKNHSFLNGESHLIRQSTCDKWNDENFLNKHWEPHLSWTRKCQICDQEEHASTPLDANSPWSEA